MKTYLILILLSLPALSSDLNKATSDMRARTRSAPIPIPLPPAGTEERGRSRYSSSEAQPQNRIRSGRSIPFEPHLRRLEDDVIRQMHFRVKIKTSDDGTIKLCLCGYLRDRQFLKQRIDVSH